MASIATCFTLPQNPCHRHRLIFKRSPFPNRLPTFPLIQTPNFPGFASTVRESRVLLPVVRASIAAAATTAIRPGGAVESDKLPWDVRKRAMEAVDACGRRVTIGDVAGRAGLKLNEAQNALQALASDTEGFLEVSNEGDVIYVFPNDYRAKLVGKSFIMRVEPLLEKAKAVAEYLARVSFGTALIASIILVFAAIYVALLALTSKKSDKKTRKVILRLVEEAHIERVSVFPGVEMKYFGTGIPNTTRGDKDKHKQMMANSVNLFSHLYLAMVIQIKESKK